MALIPKLERKPEKKPVSARLDEETRAMLDQYAKFIGDASHEYVIAGALRLLFERDKEFAKWLTQNSSSAPAKPEVSVVPTQPAKATARVA